MTFISGTNVCSSKDFKEVAIDLIFWERNLKLAFTYCPMVVLVGCNEIRKKLLINANGSFMWKDCGMLNENI